MLLQEQCDDKDIEISSLNNKFFKLESQYNMQLMNTETIQNKIQFLEAEALHRKKLHEEEILKIRRASDELYENI